MFYSYNHISVVPVDTFKTAYSIIKLPTFLKQLIHNFLQLPGSINLSPAAERLSTDFFFSDIHVPMRCNSADFM